MPKFVPANHPQGRPYKYEPLLDTLRAPPLTHFRPGPPYNDEGIISNFIENQTAGEGLKLGRIPTKKPQHFDSEIKEDLNTVRGVPKEI